MFSTAGRFRIRMGNRRRCSCPTANWSVAVLRLRRAVRMPKVTYELTEGSRFRHVAHFLRWRDDRTPALYIYDQLERSATFELNDIVPGSRQGIG